jgi:IS30 family transposase
VDFPDDQSMRVCHEAIYQSLYVQGRGALRRELTACLRTGRALRVPRARARRGKSFITSQVMISQRPAEAADRAVPGHWEGDLIIGLGSSAIGTLVERTTRFTMLLHLPPITDQGPRVKNGPALAGHGAEAVRDAIAQTITTLAEQLRRSLTWDQGTEMAQHVQLRVQAGLPVYFCDPHSPWSAAATRTPTGCCASTSPKAPTSPGTAPRISPRSLPPSTADRARRWAGGHPPRRWRSTWPLRPDALPRSPRRSPVYLSTAGGGR